MYWENAKNTFKTGSLSKFIRSPIYHEKLLFGKYKTKANAISTISYDTDLFVIQAYCAMAALFLILVLWVVECTIETPQGKDKKLTP